MEIGFAPDDLVKGLPLLLLVFGSLALVVLDALAPGRRRRLAGTLALGLLALALLATLSLLEAFRGVNELDPVRQGRVTHLFAGSFLVDTPHLMGHLLLLGSALAALLIALGSGLDGTRPARFSALLLLATTGGMLLVSGANLMLCFLGLQILSLPILLLASGRPGSLEAAAGALLMRAFTAAIFVFGLALLYAGRGTLELPLFRIQWVARAEATGLAGLGATLVLAALLAGASLPPFDMSAPHLHRRAPLPIAALLATGAKSAALVLMMAMGTLLPAEIRHAVPVIAVVAMTAGSLGALRTTELRRLLAFLAIAHSGFLLVGVNSVLAAMDWPDAWQSVRGVYFYLVAYVLAYLGAIGIVAWLERGAGRGLCLEDLAGLGRRHPLAAALFALFLLSLGGLPLTAGFWARFYLFSQALRQGFFMLSVLGLLLAAAGLFGSLRIVAVLYWQEPRREGPAAAPSLSMALPIGLSAAGVLLFGLLDPSLLFDFLFGLQI